MTVMFTLNDTLSTCLLGKTCKNTGVKKKKKTFWFPRRCKICVTASIFTLLFDNEYVQLIADETTNQVRTKEVHRGVMSVTATGQCVEEIRYKQ